FGSYFALRQRPQKQTCRVAETVHQFLATKLNLLRGKLTRVPQSFKGIFHQLAPNIRRFTGDYLRRPRAALGDKFPDLVLGPLEASYGSQFELPKGGLQGS